MYKKFDEQRPQFLYRMWFVLMVINLLCALSIAYVDNLRAVGHGFGFWACTVMTLVCFFNIKLWQYYIDNPDKYKKILDASKTGKRLKDKQDKKEEDK